MSIKVKTIKKNLLVLTLASILLFCFVIFLITIYLIPYKAQAYKNFSNNETTGVVITQPNKIQSYISKLAPEYTKWIKQIPKFTSLQPGPIKLEWFHNLPREVSLVFNYIPNIGHEVYLVVNEKNNSTIFVNELNDSGFIRNLCFANWDSPKVSPYKSSIWLTKGYIQAKNETIKAFNNQITKKITLSNNHLIEIYWDNSNSDLSILKELILSCYRPRGIAPYIPCLDYLVGEMSWFYMCLDLIEDDLVKGNLKISTSDDLESIASCIDQLSEWAQNQIPKDIDFKIIFQSVNDGIINWDLEFSKFEPHLKKALGTY